MLEIQPEGNSHPAFFSIAKLLGLHYGCYVSDQLTPEGDMRVDVGASVEMVRGLLDLTPS
jgi:hypothetical protein